MNLVGIALLCRRGRGKSLLFVDETPCPERRNDMARQQATIEFEAIEFPSAHEAIQYSFASGRGEAILLQGKNLVVSQHDADRLATAGVSFAYLCDDAGQIVTIPVN
jgi:hypothetical protein